MSKPLSPRIIATGLACLTLMLACSLFSSPATDEPQAPPEEPQPAASNTPRPTDPPKPTNTSVPPTEPPPPPEPSCARLVVTWIGTTTLSYSGPDTQPSHSETEHRA